MGTGCLHGSGWCARTRARGPFGTALGMRTSEPGLRLPTALGEATFAGSFHSPALFSGAGCLYTSLRRFDDVSRLWWVARCACYGQHIARQSYSRCSLRGARSAPPTHQSAVQLRCTGRPYVPIWFDTCVQAQGR